MKPNQKKDGVTVMKNYQGGNLKYGKVTAEGKPRSTYEKAMDALKTPSTKVEGKTKKGKAVTKSNAKGKLGSKNSRKRN
jgi:hypothetical protein